jgi:hypothetical protein
MRVRSFVSTRILKLTTIVIFSLLTTSCLSIDLSVTVQNADRIDVTVRYSVDRNLYDLGVFDENTPYRTVPITRDDAQRIAVRTDGATLQSYESRTEGNRTTVSVTYRVSGVEGFEQLFGGTDLARIEFTDSGGTLSFTASPGNADLKADERDLLEQLFGDEQAVLTVRTPQSIKSLANGERSGERNATFSTPMSRLMQSSEPVIWQVRW